MALTKSVRILAMCFTVFAIAACAKKNNDLRKNAANMAAVGANTQAANDAAKAAGYDVQFQAVNAPVSSSGGLSVTTRISINNNYYDITTTHGSYGNSAQPAVANQNIGNASLQVSAMCGDQYCNPYYIMINVTTPQGQQILQTAALKYFYYTGVQSQNDVYYSRTAGQFLSFPQAVTELQNGSQQAAAATP